MNSPFLTHTWRSSLSPADFAELNTQHGAMEMRRQEVIWELCETERSFVSGLRGVIRVFTLPLRSPLGPWIKGVPVPVARLLDWLDDIVYLHAQISDALEQVRCEAGEGPVERVAEAVLPFVAKLDLHQPYLVRFEAVTKVIDEMSADPDSDFGEFVRMQSRLEECGGLSLSSFLLKPVQRLMKYPLFFKQLCELTPADHPDHLATLSLLTATDKLIRIMQEVKSREDDYEEAKLLQSRLKGLPEAFQLAVRDRRLLHHGPLRRVHVSDKDKAALDNAAAGGPGRRVVSSGSAGSARSTKTAASRAMSPYSGGRPKTPKAEAAIKSPLLGADEGNPRFSPRFGSPDGSFDLSTFGTGVTAGPVKRVVKTRAKESSVYAFVFSDVVILAAKSAEATPSLSSAAARFGRVATGSRTPTLSGKRASEIGPSFRLIEGFGLARVSGVSDLSGKTEHDHLLELDLVPLGPAETDSRLSKRSSVSSQSSASAQPVTLHLTLPEPTVMTPTFSPRMHAPLKDRHRWIAALERSHVEALRALAFPGMLTSLTAPITQDEWWGAADAAAGASAPKRVLPRSPSSQLLSRSTSVRARARSVSDKVDSIKRHSTGDPEVGAGAGPDGADQGPRRPSLMGSAVGAGELALQEREERGWWSVRLRQVTKEMEMEAQAAAPGSAVVARGVRMVSGGAGGAAGGGIGVEGLGITA